MRLAQPHAGVSGLVNAAEPKHVRDVEIYYGQLGVLLEEADELLHGKPLAKTSAVVSVITATGLFLVAARFPD
jgi:hypothetical protein